jgi:hypothetical protein
VLRRLDDEPLAVPDSAADHVAGCGRCSSRRTEIAQDTELASRLLSTPRLVSDPDLAWARLRRELVAREHPLAGRTRPSTPPRWGPRPFPAVSLRAGLAILAVAVALVGTAVAATVTTIFAPTHVTAVTLSQGDLQAISAFVGLGDGQALGGFPGPTGSTTFRFGTIDWSSAPTHQVSSLAAASAAAGFPVSLPTHLPAGVGSVRQFVVQPRVRAKVTLGAAAGTLAGTSVTLGAGPAVVAEYAASTGGADVPTLAVATMPRPVAASSGASLAQIEAFLLAQRGIPPALAEEVRLLGDLRTTLPVPVPQGANVHSVQVAGWPGVLVADGSNALSGVVWEDGQGMLHVVAGLLDSQDVLNVAAGLG